jgi:hypothetical protein
MVEDRRFPERECRKRPSRWLKDQVLASQNHRCLGCDKPLADVEFDHVVPLSLGGSNQIDNWAALCPRCHRRKTSDDLRRLAKAKRQRRYHETGKSRAPRSMRRISGVWLKSGFDTSKRRHLNGVVTPRCNCAKCKDKFA